MNERIEFSELLGKTLVSVVVSDDPGWKGERVTYKTETGEVYEQYHQQDCCEYVSVEDIVGELSDLIGFPLVMAEEISNSEDPPAEDRDEFYTWTYYKLATQKGYVTIRWFGTSNGYYSEEVNTYRVV